MTIENRLYTLLFKPDRERHIALKSDRCDNCTEKTCMFVCPAGCYRLVDEKIEYSYEGCLECGACRLACERDAIDWKYPRGGFGVYYRHG